MNRLETFLSHIFPSDPAIGYIGSIDLNIWLAQIAGVPILGLKKESTGLKIILLFYGILMITFTNVIYTGCELYDLILNGSSLDALTQNCCLSLVRVTGIMKIINMFYRLSDIRKAADKLKYVTKKFVVSDKQRMVFFRGEFENKLFLIVYVSIVGFTACLAIIMLFNNSEEVFGNMFPYRAKFPLWVPYKMQLFYMSISLLMSAVQIVAIDYLNITLMNQIRFQLNVLILAFDELQNTSKMDNPTERLNSIVRHHCFLRELRNEVEHIYRFPILMQFLSSLVIFALTGFQATVQTGDAKDSLIIYFYCGCIFCELFLYCWFGNDVFEQSKTLSTSGFGSSWYQLDNRFKKSLMIFLANAQQPFLFTAGGFLGLSLSSFAGILSKSYSYIAVLRQLYGR